MDFKLTIGQQKAVEVACQRYLAHEQFTCICGYAGTGKTTIMPYIVERLGLKHEQIHFCAYTGKATLVLQNKLDGHGTFSTVHKLIYNAFKNRDGSFDFVPVDSLPEGLQIVFVDEVSMLPKDMWNLLLKYGVHVIAFGDDKQLPPVNEEQNNHILDEPHAFLEQIVRQKHGNTIIEVATYARRGRRLAYGKTSECQIVHKEHITDKLLSSAQQVLCAKNKTRKALNERIRTCVWGDGYSLEPLSGDKVICLQNYNKFDPPLLNGSLGIIKNVRKANIKPYGTVLRCDFLSDEGKLYEHLLIDYNLLMTGQSTFDLLQIKKHELNNAPELYQFDYGYAITVHKAQGSEFKNVILFDEWLSGDPEEHRKWLYTGITRASRKLIIAR